MPICIRARHSPGPERSLAVALDLLRPAPPRLLELVVAQLEVAHLSPTRKVPLVLDPRRRLAGRSARRLVRARDWVVCLFGAWRRVDMGRGRRWRGIERGCTLRGMGGRGGRRARQEMARQLEIVRVGADACPEQMGKSVVPGQPLFISGARRVLCEAKGGRTNVGGGRSR